MRPHTLAEAVETICGGATRDVVPAEFVDTFDLAKTDQERCASIEREPRLTGDDRLAALVGAVAEYLARRHRVGRVPPWAGNPARRLASAWFTTPSPAAAMRENSPPATSLPSNGRCGAPVPNLPRSKPV
jgi:hypothetical protein